MNEMKRTVAVRVDSSRPIFIEADADSFGEVFASMDSSDQVEVLRAMVEHMKKWPTQWDHIAIELGFDGNQEIVAVLRGLFQ